MSSYVTWDILRLIFIDEIAKFAMVMVVVVYCLLWVFNNSNKTNSSDAYSDLDKWIPEIAAEGGIEEEEVFDEGTLVLLTYLEEEKSSTPFHRKKLTLNDSLKIARDFYAEMNNRRSVRAITSESVPMEIIKNIINTAGRSAPSGGNQEPWKFVAIGDVDYRAQLRTLVATQTDDDSKMDPEVRGKIESTNAEYIKNYLTDAPWIIAVFRKEQQQVEERKRRINIYNEISTSLSISLVLAAIQNAGLVTALTIPWQCSAGIEGLLKRPENDKLVCILPVGYPAADAKVRELRRRTTMEIL